jgi:RNA polymerase sigma-70 factor (ECF subfamily)
LKKNQTKREQFERLVDEHYNAISQTALRLTKNLEESNDLTQETLLRAYRKYHLFDGVNFKAWILRLLTNVYLNKIEAGKRNASTTALEEQPFFEPVDPESNMPDRIYFDKLIEPEIEHALALVPLDFRIAVILSDMEGMSYEEISEATEVPVGTVRSRLARGRAILKHELKAYAKNKGYF